jgi:hypothetical protein
MERHFRRLTTANATSSNWRKSFALSHLDYRLLEEDNTIMQLNRKRKSWETKQNKKADAVDD